MVEGPDFLVRGGGIAPGSSINGQGCVELLHRLAVHVLANLSEFPAQASVFLNVFFLELKSQRFRLLRLRRSSAFFFELL
jgi:hypothetical protein